MVGNAETMMNDTPYMPGFAPTDKSHFIATKCNEYLANAPNLLICGSDLNATFMKVVH